MGVTQQKGDIAVTQAIATFTRMGYTVSVPVTESAQYDLVVDTGERLERVQVKFCGNKQVDLRRIHSNSRGYVVKEYDKNGFDWLYVFKPTGEEFLIKELEVRTCYTPKDEHLITFGA